MPVTVNSNPANCNPRSSVEESGSKPSAEPLAIGLINNMPDGALEATERQFVSLLNAASDGIPIRLSFHALPGIPRNEFGTNHIARFYSSAETLWNTRLDGLIVTGREPLSPNLRDEPYWESFTKVLEWAKEYTHSTVWSCLAAHAATLHMDDINRIKSEHKRFGIFECEQLSGHPLTDGTPSCFRMPHSRWNGLPEDKLTASGYQVLTRAADMGVDTFVKHGKSMFVFFQGHPEYESSTLLLEYRRDVGRYLRGETATYPLMPQNYFDRDTSIALNDLQRKAGTRPPEELIADLSEILEKQSIENTWSSTAARLYRNWLQHIRAQKVLRQSQRDSIPLRTHKTDDSMPPASAGYTPSSAIFALDQ